MFLRDDDNPMPALRLRRYTVRLGRDGPDLVADAALPDLRKHYERHEPLDAALLAPVPAQLEPPAAQGAAGLVLAALGDGCCLPGDLIARLLRVGHRAVEDGRDQCCQE